jgi:rubrerythrin
VIFLLKAMYPSMAEKAKNENRNDAVAVFNANGAVEKTHAKAFEDALAALKKGGL